MAPTLERITEGSILGEAPHWDAATQTLYLVDIVGKKILKYVPATKKISEASVAKSPSFIIPVAGKKDQFVISLGNEIVVISWDGGSAPTIIEKLATAPSGSFNDAKCDATGRLWAGTHTIASELTKTEPLGILYTLEKKQLKPQLDKIKIANGLAFNEKAKKMYYIDSLKHTVDQFDFDVTSGLISNRQVLFTTTKHNIEGIPDGMTIDTDGNLWVAVFGGKTLLKVDTKQNETLLDSIDFPTEQVTSVTFGGQNLDELFVTTAALNSEGKKQFTPEYGATYRVLGTGSKGLPGVSIQL